MSLRQRLSALGLGARGWVVPEEAARLGVCPRVRQRGLQAGASQDSVELQDWTPHYTGRGEQVTFSDLSFYTCQSCPGGQGPKRKTLSKSLVT